MLEFLEKYSANYFSSQCGEEGICIEIAKRLKIVEGKAIEAGAQDGLFCSNTALLIRDYGWHGLMIESDHERYLKCCENWKDNPRVRCQHLMVDESNINSLVDESCDLLSLDTDGPDHAIFGALRVNPKIVIIEIDSSIPPDKDYISAEGGAGFLPMARLIQSKGMFVLAHTGNVIGLREEFHPFFPEINVDPLRYPERYFNRKVLTGERDWLDR